MIFNSEQQSIPNKKRYKTSFIIKSSEAFNTTPDSSFNTENTSHTAPINADQVFNNAMHSSEAKKYFLMQPTSNRQTRIRQSLQTQLSPDKIQNNEPRQQNRKCLTQITTTDSQRSIDQINYINNKNARYSLQPDLSNYKQSSSLIFLNNSQISNNQNKNQQNEDNSEYYYPKIKNSNISPLSQKQKQQGSINEYFPSQNTQQYNKYTQNLKQKSFETILSQQKQLPYLNNQTQEYAVDRVKSLQNLSLAYKKIEELETNTNNILQNKKNGDLQQNSKTDSNRQIQFSQKYIQQSPNIYVSPVDLLKKLPSKGVLKNLSRPYISSQSMLDLDDDNSQKSNENIQTTTYHNMNKYIASSLDEIPEIKPEQYDKIQSQTDLNQKRIKRVVRNGQVIKKIMNDSYNPYQESTQKIAQSTSSPKKKSSQVIFTDQSLDFDFKEVIQQNTTSPKKKVVKIQFNEGHN